MSVARFEIKEGHPKIRSKRVTDGPARAYPRVYPPRKADHPLVLPVEEVLRYDLPVQFRTRTTLADVDLAGGTIPKGASVALLLASGSRDPARFRDADHFVPDRAELGTLARRLVGTRLVTDPLPYSDNASLRGPEHLFVEFDGLR